MDIRTIPTIVLLGVQGSGKGTQAELLAKHLGIPTFSIGAMFREEIAKKTQFGALAESYVKSGELVPDDVTNVFLRFFLSRIDAKAVILDGYPRTIGQAHALETIGSPMLVIDVRISDVEAAKRLTGRRVCKECGTVFHIDFYPSSKGGKCDRCDGLLEQREDDSVEIIKKRLAIYHAAITSVLQYYDEQGKLRVIDGERSINEVEAELVRQVEECVDIKQCVSL